MHNLDQKITMAIFCTINNEAVSPRMNRNSFPLMVLESMSHQDSLLSVITILV